jgi:protein O-GlcNAc transferase
VSLPDCESLALKLANDRTMLAEIKARLSANRDKCPVFDTARYTRHMEFAFRTMYDRHQRGERPEHLDVAAIAPDG